ncbi:MAG: hypothetical protein KDK75_10160 [Alphaproteobacteria bacterium]|nr:hypothetical protein [Alphaproteobacteria bacterium]
MMRAAVADGGLHEDRKDLALELRQLLSTARSWPLPFAGSYVAFHGVFGNRLVIDVDPRQVTHQFPPNRVIAGQNVAAADYFLGRGPWAPMLEPLDKSVIHREVAELLAHGGRYRGTAGYAALVRRLEAGRPAIRNLQDLDSIARIDGYFEDLHRLIVSIRDNGYRRRPDYDGLESASDAAKASSPVRPVLVELMESEIGIGVDADGSLVRVGPGNHRMAIARQLGLARVPVELRLFHAAWVRRQMAQGKGPLQSITAGVRRIGAKQQRNISGDHP